jgi:hypothetical protein
VATRLSPSASALWMFSNTVAFSPSVASSQELSGLRLIKRAPDVEIGHRSHPCVGHADVIS